MSVSVNLGSPLCKRSMFPCKYLTGSNMHSLASQNFGTDKLAVFDTVFTTLLDVKPPDMTLPWTYTDCRAIDVGPVATWLQSVVGDTGMNRLFGRVPVTVHDVTISGCMAVGGETVAKIEFITHRYGDTHGVHYAAQIGTRPYRFLWFTRVGTVPEGSFALTKGVSQYDNTYAGWRSAA